MVIVIPMVLPLPMIAMTMMRIPPFYQKMVTVMVSSPRMIAMMLIPDPNLIIADEPTSALDVTVRMQVLRILDDLVSEKGLGLMFISHDLKVVRALSDELIVMRDGQVVELGSAHDIFESPQEEYTKALMAAAFELEALETGAVRT